MEKNENNDMDWQMSSEDVLNRIRNNYKNEGRLDTIYYQTIRKTDNIQSTVKGQRGRGRKMIDDVKRGGYKIAKKNVQDKSSDVWDLPVGSTCDNN